MKKLSSELVEELAVMQKRFKEIYYDGFKVSGIGESKVQIDFETMLNTFPIEEVVYSDRDCEVYPYEFTTVQHGVEFLTVADAKEVVDLKDTHPEVFKRLSYLIQSGGE